MGERRLPHIYPEGRWLFVTWHLHGSIRSARFPPPHKLSAGEAFVWMDRYLDRAACGPLFLRQEPIANLVIESLFRGVQLEHYQLRAFVLMANHVHVLLLPLIAPSRLLKSLKGFTAREANRLLGRTGEPFWQRESYDHWARDEAECVRITRYIEQNPVKAGLVFVRAGVSLVQCARNMAGAVKNSKSRHECRLGTHECVRHVKIGTSNRAACSAIQPPSPSK